MIIKLQMVGAKEKFLLTGLVIVILAVLVVWLVHKPAGRENFKIETSIESDSYIATQAGDPESREHVSLRDGMPDGYGVITRPDGSVYVGNFANGQIQGKGKISYPGGASYEGEFREGKPHGDGICTYSTGESEECTFVLGQRQ